MSAGALHIEPSDRDLLARLLPELQRVCALIRGLLAVQPHPEPRGEWGRPVAAPLLRPIPARAAAPEPSPAAIPVKLARRTHTPASRRRDARQIEAWLAEAGIKASRLSYESGINLAVISNIRHRRDGMSVAVETALRETVERLTRRRSAP